MKEFMKWLLYVSRVSEFLPHISVCFLGSRLFLSLWVKLNLRSIFANILIKSTKTMKFFYLNSKCEWPLCIHTEFYEIHSHINHKGNNYNIWSIQNWFFIYKLFPPLINAWICLKRHHIDMLIWIKWLFMRTHFEIPCWAITCAYCYAFILYRSSCRVKKENIFKEFSNVVLWFMSVNIWNENIQHT